MLSDNAAHEEETQAAGAGTEGELFVITGK